MSTFNYDKFFTESLQQLKQEGRYRVFADILRHVGEFPVADYQDSNSNKKVTIWCSNDYLGMGHHPQVLEEMARVLKTHGAGAGGTRNISGTHHYIVELERELADLHDKPAALVFTSGYVANQTALSAIGSLLPDCVIFSDAANHASMIEGIRYSKAQRHVFRHNDLEHLEQLLKQVPLETPKLLAFESVYSMDGDISPMGELCDLADKYGALKYLDETHAVGLYGYKSGGLAQRDGLTPRFDIIQGGLGKAFGVVGGFVTGSAKIIDAIRSYGTGFIFTTSLPPVVAAGALTSVKYLKKSPTERRALYERVMKTKHALTAAGLPIMSTPSHIIPVMVGDSFRCKQATDHLLNEFDIYIQPINYPTVPRGTERLRITPTPLHTDKMIDHLVSSMLKVWKELDIKLAA